MSLKRLENDVNLEAYFPAIFRSREDIRRVYSARLKVGLSCKNKEDTFRIKKFDDWQKMLAQGEKERVAILLNPDKLPDPDCESETEDADDCESESEETETQQLQGAY
jgi:hypothetical protein